MVCRRGRVGQQTKITRRWARRGTRPSASQDRRTASTDIFGAICPATGVTAGLVLPWCNTEAMGLHLAEISPRVPPGKHCALLVDQAGWRAEADRGGVEDAWPEVQHHALHYDCDKKSSTR